jgi:serine/threonine protein kinase
MDSEKIRTKRPGLRVSEESQQPESVAVPSEYQQERAPTVVAGRYEIIGRLPAGRTGTVWKAKDTKTGEFVAVRVFSRFESKNPLLLSRFKKGLDQLSTLSHPHIVGPCDSGVTEDNVPYVVTPFIEKATLKEAFSIDNPLSESKGVEIFVQIAEALAHAHAIGVGHGNFSVANVFMQEDKQGFPRIVLTDFGMESLCQSSMLDPQDDVYAFGALMYECVNGSAPGIKDSNTQEAPFRNPISPELKSIILKCLSSNRKDRYVDGSEVLDILIAMRCHRLPKPPKHRPWQTLMTPKVLIPLVACVVLATAAICALVSIQSKPSVSSSTPAVPAQTPPVANIVPLQRTPVVRMKRTAAPLTTGEHKAASQTPEPVPLESLQQPIPLEPAETAAAPSSLPVNKEKFENTAKRGE